MALKALYGPALLVLDCHFLLAAVPVGVFKFKLVYIGLEQRAIYLQLCFATWTCLATLQAPFALKCYSEYLEDQGCVVPLSACLLIHCKRWNYLKNQRHSKQSSVNGSL